MLLGWQQLSVAFNLFTLKRFNTAKAPENLRILTWNLSSWGESNRSNKKNNMDSMVSVIKNIDADVLCFQEYLYCKNKIYRDSIIPAFKESGYQYAYFAKVRYSGRLYETTSLTAVVIMSKYPIIDSAKFYYSADKFEEPLLYADIKIKDQTIRFFTTHLRSVNFQSDDYKALQNLKEPVNANVTKSRLLLWKLRVAYKERTAQAELLHKQIKESPHPVIVCGDFNDVPNSYTYFKVKGNLQDAFVGKRWGFGRTLRFISPTLRIDYILADKRFDIKQYTELKFPLFGSLSCCCRSDITNSK
jgi:endonuclease/exonuclease/phosphatase family metal-dependent hydrolase